MEEVQEKFTDLMDKVERILKEIPDTRNSDIRLTIWIWEVFYSHLLYHRNGRTHVDVEDLFKLPREDRVKRLRAIIQNVDKKYPPTDWETAKLRGWHENDWKRAMGYCVENPDQLRLGV